MVSGCPNIFAEFLLLTGKRKEEHGTADAVPGDFWLRDFQLGAPVCIATQNNKNKKK